MNVPIGCAGVLVMPGDIIAGDGEGVVAVPAQHAEEVAHDVFEQEQKEAFFTHKVAAGNSIRGIYPPSAHTMVEYEIWKNEQNNRSK